MTCNSLSPSLEEYPHEVNSTECILAINLFFRNRKVLKLERLALARVVFHIRPMFGRIPASLAGVHISRIDQCLVGSRRHQSRRRPPLDKISLVIQ
jgi:hypothetical protein